MVKKSLLSKFLKLFISKKKRFGKNISADEAINIQSEYATSYCDDDKLPNYPYVEIAKQLASDKAEVFNAALYYLNKIAQNEPKNRIRIADLLKSISQESNLPDENKKLILQTIDDIITK